MNKNEKLLQAFIDIDTATEVSHATLSEIMDNIEDDIYKYIILGVMEQLEKIKKSTQAMKGKVMVA